MQPTRRVLLLGAAAATLSGCATAGKSEDASSKGNASAANPLGVPEDAGLEVVIFKGGHGDQYAIDAGTLYEQRYPKANVDHKGIQRVGEVLQPRFIATRHRMSSTTAAPGGSTWRLWFRRAS